MPVFRAMPLEVLFMEYGEKEAGKVSEIKVQGLSGGWKFFMVLMFIVIIAQFAYIMWADGRRTTVIWRNTSGQAIPTSYEREAIDDKRIERPAYQAPSNVYWVADLAEASLPFVVNIRSESVREEVAESPVDNMEPRYKEIDPRRPPNEDQIEQFRKFFEERGFQDFNWDEYHNFPRVGEGSGFIISEDGYIVTNAHLVADFNRFTVTLNGGKEYEGELVGRDDMKDIAVIKIDATGLPSAHLGDSDSIRPGEPAVAIGSPFGLKKTVTAGIISTVDRPAVEITQTNDPRTNKELIQTDASIHPGNSGGPLLNAKGEVIGVNEAIILGANSIGFAIPINSIKRSIESIIEHGNVRYPGLGIRIEDLSPEWAEEYEYTVKEGVLVREVTQDLPGAIAGLKAGDVITEIEGAKLTAGDQLIVEIQKHEIGDKITLTVYPQGKEPAKEILVVLGEIDLGKEAFWRMR